MSETSTDTSTDTPPSESPIPSGGSRADSLVLVNTGDGKGKSSAAFGVMVRGLAMEWPVAVIQFVKSGKWKVGEEKLGRQLGVDWHSVGEGFTWDSDNLDHDKAIAADGWAAAAEIITAGEHRLVILDEITYLMNWGWVDADAVVDVIRNRPDHVNIVATGRDASDALIEVADTVTEMRKVKHAYDTGILAKRGIDY
ncbi:MAG: cob(I)yrinic acid a,c-diamide adenosyltransferase [Actinomycetota bacterium]